MVMFYVLMRDEFTCEWVILQLCKVHGEMKVKYSEKSHLRLSFIIIISIIVGIGYSMVAWPSESLYGGTRKATRRVRGSSEPLDQDWYTKNTEPAYQNWSLCTFGLDISFEIMCS